MILRPFSYALAALSVMVAPSPGASQTVLPGNHSVDGALCVGPDCTNSESFGLATQKLKSANPILRFEDTSTLTGAPTRDWELHANAFFGSGEYFGLFDAGTNRMVFQVDAGAPANSFHIGEFGRIGVGTTTPAQDLHILSNGGAGLRLENTGNDKAIYELLITSESFVLFDQENGLLPFRSAIGAPSHSIYIQDTGNIGLGTFSPDAPLEVSTDDSFAFLRLTAEAANVNESVDITFTGGPLGTGQLRYNIVDGDNQEMSLDADGNMVLDGTLTTAGPTCAGGCDRVFEAGYALPRIEDRAAQMYTLGHLPAIGPTTPGRPVNISETLGQIINELEHAHIYIDQLNAQAAQDRRAIAALTAELIAVRQGMD